MLMSSKFPEHSKVVVQYALYICIVGKTSLWLQDDLPNYVCGCLYLFSCAKGALFLFLSVYLFYFIFWFKDKMIRTPYILVGVCRGLEVAETG